MKPAPTTYRNRRTKRLETEAVYGESAVQWVYGTSLGQLIAESILTKKSVSRLYGWLQDTRWSSRKINPFIERFKIPVQEYEPGPWKTFNGFFVRKFRQGARPFDQDPRSLPAFAEARYFAFERVNDDSPLPVKGLRLSPSQLLGDPVRARPFENGPALVARLCPTDYHRFHYPDHGKTLESYALHGKLHSVNPAALHYRGDILISNERRVSILETHSFGRLAYVEIGALCVGKIVATHDERVPFARGDEKGCFLFGASSVVVLGESGRWTPHADLLEQTAQGRETFVQLGEAIASSK